MATTAGTIKHRHQTVLPDGTSDVDASEWNDSEVIAGGTNGDLLTRDSTQTDGWGWADPIVGSGVAVVQTTTVTGTQHNVALTANATVLRCANGSALTITGLSAGYDGQQLLILSMNAQVNLVNESASSTAANRLKTNVTATIPLAAGSGNAWLTYDAGTARWKLIAHYQGAAIVVPYVASDFTGNAGSWTVDSGDLITFRYLIDAARRTMAVVVTVATSSVSGGPTALQILIPGGFSAPTTYETTFYYNDAGTGGVGLLRASANTIYCIKPGSAAWGTATNTTEVRFQIGFEVS